MEYRTWMKLDPTYTGNYSYASFNTAARSQYITSQHTHVYLLNDAEHSKHARGPDTARRRNVWLQYANNNAKRASVIHKVVS